MLDHWIFKYDVHAVPMVTVETMLVILAGLRFRLGEYFPEDTKGLHEGEIIRIRRLSEDVIEVQVNLQAAMTAEVDEESPERQEANAEVDLAFRPVFDVVSGWADNTYPAFAAKREAAIAIRDALFPDGSIVLRPPFKTKWAVLDARLKLIEERRLTPAFRQLGMADMIVPLTATVERLGKSLRITEVKGKTTMVGDALDACKEVVREVQRAVVGTIRRDDKVSLERAAEALLPLYEVKQEIAEARRTSRADDRKVEEPVAPVAVVTPPAAPAVPAVEPEA